MHDHNLWLSIAEQDLELAQLAFDRGSAKTIAPAFFHTQQCAEKALKAFLTFLRLCEN